jgi:hypothetical protein
VNFVADESVDQQIVVHLRKEGHAVQYIVETGPGASDADVWNFGDVRAERAWAVLRISPHP